MTQSSDTDFSFYKAELRAVQQQQAELMARKCQLDEREADLAAKLEQLAQGPPLPAAAYTDDQLRAAITTAVWDELETMGASELREALADLLVPSDSTPRHELLEDIADRAEGMTDDLTGDDLGGATPVEYWLRQYCPEDGRPAGPLCAVCAAELVDGECPLSSEDGHPSMPAPTDPE